MVNDEDTKVARIDPAARAARQEFFGWQCRIRQLSVRQADGRPTSGMQPRVSLPPDEPDLGHITVLIRKRASQEVTAQIQHLVRRTRDPAERFESGLRFLAAAYYQHPEEFSDAMTALFAPHSPLARRLIDMGHCMLDFEQYSQHYRLSCRVEALARSDPGFQFTYWHNSLFNPAIPGDAQILGFKPSWSESQNFP